MSNPVIRTSVFLLSLILLGISSCQNNPSDVGLSFINPDDTTGVRYLDSETDSLEITSSTLLKPINTTGSSNIFIGKFQNYEARSIVRFYNITGDYDSANVLSATLNLRSSGYFFEDSTFNTAFNIYRVNEKLNLNSITVDSITPGSIGTVPLGSYSGVVADTQSISIPLDNQTVKDWLEYAADTSYSVKNYGIMLQPNSGSGTIKSFFNFDNAIEVIPYITVIVQKNSNTDTITLNISESVWLADAPGVVFPPDRFVVQNGIAFRSALSFDLSKLPQNAIINSASIQFNLDQDASFISRSGSRNMVAGLINDSSLTSDTLFSTVFPRDSVTYVTTINQIFQSWNNGNLTNLGLAIRGFFELQNIDRFVFYGPTATDVSKRPRLKIYYTIRD